MESYVDVENRFLSEARQIAKQLAKQLANEEDYRCFWQEAENIVFQQWLKQECYDELITYVLYNFADGGGTNWWDDLRYHLKEKKDVKRIRRLFQGLIPGRVARYRKELKYAQQGWVGNMAYAAEHKAESLRAMYEYFSCMVQLGETSVADDLRERIKDTFFDKRRKIANPIDKELTREGFWELVSEARRIQDSEGFISALEAKLAEYKAKEIVKFHQIVLGLVADLWSWDLWALAYIARGGCSDDAFEYFRAWVISQGGEAYDAAIESPEALMNAIVMQGDMQCEELLDVGGNAYYERQGKAMPTVKPPRCRKKGREWREDELEQRYPLLWERFQLTVNGTAPQ